VQLTELRIYVCCMQLLAVMRLPSIATAARAELAARGGTQAFASMAAAVHSALTEQLAELATADIVESQSLRGAIDPRIEPLWRPISLCGPVFTVRSVAGDNLAVHRALEAAPAGSILCVESCGTMDEVRSRALIGDIIGYAALKRGIGGLVTNAPIRDGRRLQTLGFPVFAMGRQIRGPTKSDPGELGQPIMLGGVEIITGRDLICGDDDGLVVVPAATGADVVAAAQARAAAEAGVLQQLDAGASTLDIYG
jgi:4-hydroxy-4-methyl-2-oxoglutarate aldolase